jgi:hypothetical protein
MDGNNIVIWLAVTGVGIGGSLICWLMNRTISRLDRDMEEHGETLKEHKELHGECKLELAQFRTEVHREFAKDATVQHQLARIHERIDRLPKEIIDAIKGLMA